MICLYCSLRWSEVTGQGGVGVERGGSLKRSKVPGKPGCCSGGGSSMRWSEVTGQARVLWGGGVIEVE